MTAPFLPIAYHYDTCHSGRQHPGWPDLGESWFAPKGAVAASAREQITAELVAGVMRAEGARDPAAARGLCWLIWREIKDWWVGAERVSASEPPRYVVRVGVPAGSFDSDGTRQAIIERATAVLANADASERGALGVKCPKLRRGTREDQRLRRHCHAQCAPQLATGADEWLRRLSRAGHDRRPFERGDDHRCEVASLFGAREPTGAKRRRKGRFPSVKDCRCGG